MRVVNYLVIYLSKAYVRVDHKIFIEKNLNDNVPQYIVNI